MDPLVQQFIYNYDCSQYSYLPKFIKRRVDALKKIQLEHIQIQHQYYQKLQDLELEFEKLYRPLYEKRYKIINGHHEPSDEECALPPNAAGEVLGLQGEEDRPRYDSLNTLKITEEQEKELEKNIKGIPGFWLGCLASTGHFSESIEDHDKPILFHLNDIKLKYEQEDEFLTYKIIFSFNENPYFTNKELTKTYYLKMKPDEQSPFTYEGFEVFKSVGCDIDWLPGKRPDTKMVTVKQRNKSTGQVRQKKKEVEQDTFFLFFRTPKAPSPLPDNLNNRETAADEEEIMALMSFDFELGEIIRQSLVPRAPLYYTGYVMDVESDDEDEEDDFEDESSDDDDDGLLGESGEESEEEEEEEDSLDESNENNVDGKKEAKKGNKKD